MKVTYNITQNKFNANLNQETTEIKVKFQTGYYPLPGGGGGDTSNLVPYTGANKDVNIDSNYFKTSKGFDFTFDADNYFRSFYNTYNNVLEFKSKDNSEDNSGSMYVKVDTEDGLFFYRFNRNGISENTFGMNSVGTYSKKPFISDSGFKTPTGTETQALRADGGVFDLNTKADLEGGKVPASQLPSYVDDVLEFANLASFPTTGESGKIYIAIDTNLTYRWGGSSYVVMSSSLALGETSSTAYRGDRGKIAYDHSQVTHDKTLVGLGNVDNTSDLNKPISTATQQALNNKLDKGTYTGNASDLKSLIDTKADLVDGKVPKAQSQPSTMVMNSSTYVITFTDATGAVQTIDLPLESLFKDANYNSSTKSLIVTLQDGTTRTIPLTDLVDLPEIVLATTNPAVTPTTGQKVYFNTSLGKIWFNVSGAWVFGGNLISDTEKTNLSTAYTHSQATGNPHNTKVEELSDIGSETTTIADTDVILKKEVVGGLWRKITFANFKSWFTTELAKKINIGLDTVFNFKNISAMALSDFRSITPNIETIYFTEEQNGTGWQQVRYNGLGITIPATTETVIALTNENFIELDSDSTFNLINVANTKINGIFEKDFVIIKFNAGVVTPPGISNQWFKVILKVNNVQTAVSPVFYLTETSGTVEQIAHNFALNVPTEMVTNGATLHLKTSATMTFNNPSITVVRVHKSTNANL